MQKAAVAVLVYQPSEQMCSSAFMAVSLLSSCSSVKPLKPSQGAPGPWSAE